MGMMDGLAGFMQGTAKGVDQYHQDQRRDALVEQQKIRDDMSMKLQQLQIDMATQNQETVNRRRQALGMLNSGALQGDMGRTPQEMESKHGFNPFGYVSPEQMRYRTPEQQQQDALNLYGAKKMVDSQFPKPVKPSYDVFEDEHGSQHYVSEGAQIPTGWSRVRAAPTVQIGAGGNIVGPGGVPLSKTEIRDNRSALDAVRGVSDSLDAFESLVDQHGWEPQMGTNAETVADMSSAHRAVQMQLKELLNLGVLNGPDLDLMNQMLIDPTEIPVNPLTWNNRKAQIMASIGQVREYVARKKAQHEQNLGIQPTEQQPVAAFPTQKPQGVDLIFNPNTGEFE